MKNHHYQINVEWTGNTGKGTESYKSYMRDHTIAIEGKRHEILASSDPSFRGDKNRFNPEELFLSSLSACHMLWYLHLCSVNHVVVTQYLDVAAGTMEETDNGSGRFTEVILKPHVVVSDETMIDLAHELHEEANRMCFIANSCNFSIRHTPNIKSHGNQ